MGANLSVRSSKPRGAQSDAPAKEGLGDTRLGREDKQRSASTSTTPSTKVENG